tara:strand:+ start:557 stop:709 length:153 start_codon:yes stop_codon:yes gene_type:complete
MMSVTLKIWPVIAPASAKSYSKSAGSPENSVAGTQQQDAEIWQTHACECF